MNHKKIKNTKNTGKSNTNKKTISFDELEFLKIFGKLNEKQISKIIPLLKKTDINLVCSLCSNVLFSKIGGKLSLKKKNKIREITLPKRNKYLILANKNASSGLKKKILIQEGKGIGALISLAIPLISSLVSAFTK